jgi:hypothetical protein
LFRRRFACARHAPTRAIFVGLKFLLALFRQLSRRLCESAAGDFMSDNQIIELDGRVIGLVVRRRRGYRLQTADRRLGAIDGKLFATIAAADRAVREFPSALTEASWRPPFAASRIADLDAWEAGKLYAF